MNDSVPQSLPFSLQPPPLPLPLPLPAAEAEHRPAILALGDVRVHRAEELLQLGRGAGRQEDAQDARVVVAEDEALAPLVAHAQEGAQMPAQLIQRSPRRE